jgi:5-hydroxyisourate hydrolase
VTLSTHVLDISQGRPAAGVPVRLDARRDGGWQAMSEGRTGADGRLSGWTLDEAGVYRLVFGTGDYLGVAAFYPEVMVAFQVAEPAEHYHVPLLISPYGYTTYRGS